MRTESFEALGTRLKITVWDPVSEKEFRRLMDGAIARTRNFDSLYSRFKTDSLVSRISKQTGIVEVPSGLTQMLAVYQKLYDATTGKINPAVGFALADSGYDAGYSFVPRTDIRKVPPLSEAVSIVDATHIRLQKNILLDLGALGKGYLVDQLYEDLRAARISRFLVDGSGDIRYYSEPLQPIVCGLEHPHDATLAIGTVSLSSGSLCASATNRRRWGTRNHYLNPDLLESPEDIIATWAYAENATLADGLSSALFFTAPEKLAQFSFDYAIINREMKISCTPFFKVGLFR